MFRRQMLTMIGLLCFLGAQAQGDVPILLTETYKTVKYAPGEGLKFSKAMGGQALQADGVLKLGGKSVAKLYCNGKFVEVKGKGAHKVADELGETLNNSPFGFANRFNDFLLASSDGGSATGQKVSPPGSGSGWGDKSKKIKPGIRIGAVGADEDVVFSWSAEKPATAYVFRILGKGDEAVYEAETVGAAHTVGLKALGLMPGMTYYWHVADKGDSSADTGKLDFEVKTPEARDKALAGLKNDAAYEQAGPAMKKLMEAAAFEDGGFYYAAMVAYTGALKLNTDDAIAQKLQQAYMKRMGLK